MIEAAIAEIIGGKGQVPVGCGVAIFPRGLIATCAHVIADALGIARDSPTAVGLEVAVRFPFCGRTTKGQVVAWSPLSLSDVAILRVPEEALAEPVRPVPLFQPPGVRALRFRSYGFPRGYPSGRWGYGELLDPLPGGQVQVRSSDLAPGFSGGPVQELQMGRMIGLLASYDAQTGTGFAIPSAQIGRVCAEVSISRSVNRFSPIADGLMGLPGDPLTGLETFLVEYLGSTDHPRAFGGRSEQFAELNAWLRSPSSPMAVLAAPAGRGKSALMARWAVGLCAELRADVAFVPISIRFNTAAKLRVTSLLGARLRYLSDPSLQGTVSSSDPEQWLAEIGQLLRQDLPAGRPPLIVILDGLDEATDWKAGEDLNLPTMLGDGVKVLASARTLALDRGPKDWVHRLGWPASTTTIDLPPLAFAGVADVLRSMGNPLQSLAVKIDLVAELTRLSEGDPLLVSLYVDALRGSIERAPFVAPEQLVSIGAGLDGYFEAWWQDQRKQWGSRSPLREEGVQAVLNLLACALGPLQKQDLLELASAELNRWSLEDVLERLSRFVIGDGERQGFVFAHPRLAQYSQTRLNPGELQQWNDRFATYGRQVVAGLRSGSIEPIAAPRYIVQNHVAHLTRAGAPAGDYYELLHESWVRAWQHHDGSFSGFLQDVLQVWDQADRARDISWQLFSAMAHCSLVALRAATPPALIKQAFVAGLFTESQVLALMSSLADQASQSQLISLVASTLSERSRETLLVRALDFTDESVRAFALQSLLPHLAETRFPDVIAAAQSLSDDSCRFVVLKSAAETAIAAGRQDMMEEVLVSAEAMEDQDMQAEILRDLAPALSSPMRSRMLTFACALNKPSARAQVVTALAPQLSQDLLQVALESARKIWYPYRRVLAMIAVLSRFPVESQSELLSEVVSAARSILEPDRKADALIRISSYTGAALRNELLMETLKVIDEEVGGGRRVKLLAGFPADVSPEVAAEFIRVAQSRTDAVQRIQLLSRVVGFDPSARDLVYSDALRAAESAGEFEIASIFERLAESATEQARRALVVEAERISSLSRRSAALIAISVSLPEDEQVRLLRDNLPFLIPVRLYWPSITWELDWLTGLAVKVSPAGARAMREWLSTSLSNDRAGWSQLARLQLIARLTERTPECIADSELNVYLQIIEELENHSDLAAGLDAIAPFLHGEMLQRAIALGWRIGDRSSRVGALNAVGALQTDRMLPLSTKQSAELLSLARQMRSGYSAKFFTWSIAVLFSCSGTDAAGEAALLYKGLDFADQQEVIVACSSNVDPEQLSRLCGDWLVTAHQVAAQGIREAFAKPLTESIRDLRTVIPVSLVPNFLHLLSRIDSPDRIATMLALTTRLPEQQREQPISDLVELLYKVENPAARSEILLAEPGLLTRLSAGEMLSLAGTVRDRDLVLNLLAQCCPHLSEPARPEILRYMVAQKGRLNSRHSVESMLAELLTIQLESQDFDVPMDAFAGLAKCLSANGRARFTNAALARIRDVQYYWRRDVSMVHIAEVCEPDAWVAAQEDLSGSDWVRRDREYLQEFAARTAPERLLQMAAEQDVHYLDQTLEFIVPHLPVHLLEEAMTIAQRLEDENQRARHLIKIAARQTLGEFVSQCVSLAKSYPWWNLTESLDSSSQACLVKARFRSNDELTASLRNLACVSRPDALEILRYLVTPLVELRGLEAAIGLSSAVVEVGKWWP